MSLLQTYLLDPTRREREFDASGYQEKEFCNGIQKIANALDTRLACSKQLMSGKCNAELLQRLQKENTPIGGKTEKSTSGRAREEW
ncbi:uncharacterized protein PADG_11818 [Paracoccidioides brasiliensis Pb18]|uniref:Uncharacterized protein n=1 Tax=Paracoccidioides brasiliensis (strain Pb18) TaxID=502780 RepID=A0A0A0HTQ0_PARBD|nr:uncharacterized protein PADG_11818 [Paracoccidioides brasiliensis Pb18]KGM92027.1 hypothetical protein PADG_11818 [Paracoccidioides brasiliensis Pb18]ODH52664.1 hypothetical protein GX48_01149 [Paracoccidioides brasiliensis]